MNSNLLVMMLALVAPLGFGREIHVNPAGNDSNEGTAGKPLKTITAAAGVAQPGDVITIHEGVYRERVDPPRGGESDDKRIVYQAAAGEKVVIKGSEVLGGWKKVDNETWRASIKNSFFGDFNPFADLIRGDWFDSKGREHHTAAVYLNGHWLTEAAKFEEVMKPAGESPLWFAKVEDSETTVWAQFPGVDPNREEIEVNVRQAVFYPHKAGMNFITVSGLTMMHAATPWAPPTAEQVGLIGTHWSKGWIIEDCEISHSVCTGVTLGKHGDEFDNTSANTATGYVETIKRAQKRGWSKERIGSHVVRNNHISHCEQAGIVGSMGAAFSMVTGNEIHDIHVRRLFTGAEMGGIKFHAAIDTEISGNHIHHTTRGIWLDWMSQGTRVTRNLLHDNGPQEDLFMEVNHGPFMVDHNVLLSPVSLRDWSQGGAYCHNLFAGGFQLRQVLNRETPYHPAHSTEIAGLSKIQGGDNRFLNNVFVGSTGLAPYDAAKWPMVMAGNLFLKGAKPAKAEEGAVVEGADPGVEVKKDADGVSLLFELDPAWVGAAKRQVVTTKGLGQAKIPELPFVMPDGSEYRLESDFLGGERDAKTPCPGPIEIGRKARVEVKVWPLR